MLQLYLSDSSRSYQSVLWLMICIKRGWLLQNYQMRMVHITHSICTFFTNSSDRVKTVRAQFATLPAANKHAVFRVIRFCTELLAHQTVNKMSSQNIAIVLAPSLM